jgi:hypothetical protein
LLVKKLKQSDTEKHREPQRLKQWGFRDIWGMFKKKYAIKLAGILLLMALISSCGASRSAAITCPVYPFKGKGSAIVHTSSRRGYPSQGRIVAKKQHTGMSRKIQNRKER